MVFDTGYWYAGITCNDVEIKMIQKHKNKHKNKQEEIHYGSFST